MNILEVEGVSAAYRKNTVLNDVSFSIPKGSLTGIVGPNGAGKSTLIKVLLELHPKLSGNVYFFGTSLKKVKSKVGYVPQRGSVDWDFPTDALDVVMMGMYGQIGWLKWPKKIHRKKAMEVLDKVGMADFSHHQISELSGGQQQRVFLARALIQDADLYFMDEPLAGVDAATERAIMAILRELKNKGKTVLVVHHDLQTVEDYFDRVLFLNRTVVAHGNTSSTFTTQNIEKAYGGSVRWLKEGIGIVGTHLQ
ncbi:metal ABC transporter ATP-binding protein [Fervidibacillus halotolerans]|uniref:Metal ABC transporter ATP-binding protein n=1 Tax=Fervidibacillus halotolerans TaxID=2980027 RepID=A0A9E8M1H2_9BACI|nr:metal ABC transporter ATP-binding protein [Fervidibacillus halotolerans]WAA12746.1 metal ABC transporter ATP-binding protein [Fervidibacillus halotolerans]